MNLEQILKSLRSAEVLEGDKVVEHLVKIMDKREGDINVPRGQTDIKDVDGQVLIHKRFDFGTLLAETEAEQKAMTDADGKFIGVPTTEEVHQLFDKRGIPWNKDMAERLIPYWASDERVDGHGDIVRQNWLFEEFEKNSPMPYSHDWSGMPVGRALDWMVRNRKERGYDGPALWLLGMFATDEMMPKAGQVYRLVKAGILRGGSVGFSSHKVIEVKDEEERRALGLGRWGVILDMNHLLEYSPCTIGANSGALAILGKAKAKNLIQAEDINVLRELTRRKIYKETRSKELWLERDAVLVGVAKTLFGKHEYSVHKELDKPFDAEELEAAQHKALTKGTPPPPPPKEPGSAEPDPAKPEGKPQDGSAMLTEISNGLKEVSANITALVAACQEVFSQFNQTLEDIRAQLEQMGAQPAKQPDPKEKPEGGPPPAGKEPPVPPAKDLDPVDSEAKRLSGLLGD